MCSRQHAAVPNAQLRLCTPCTTPRLLLLLLLLLLLTAENVSVRF
jgi:hypothetical protein